MNFRSPHALRKLLGHKRCVRDEGEVTEGKIQQKRGVRWRQAPRPAGGTYARVRFIEKK